MRINKIVEVILNQGFSVQLDFHGVKLVTPSFYAAVTEGLYSVFPESEKERPISIINLPESFPQRRP